MSIAVWERTLFAGLDETSSESASSSSSASSEALATTFFELALPVEERLALGPLTLASNSLTSSVKQSHLSVDACEAQRR